MKIQNKMSVSCSGRNDKSTMQNMLLGEDHSRSEVIAKSDKLERFSSLFTNFQANSDTDKLRKSLYRSRRFMNSSGK